MHKWHVSAKFIRLIMFGQERELTEICTVVQQAKGDDNAMKLILTSGEM